MPSMQNQVMGNDEESRLKSQRINQEICQRFVRLSCHKMIAGRGSTNLRRNLLILHLLQKARSENMSRVPAECKSLLESEQAVQPHPSVMAAMRRSGSSRSGSPIARKQVLGRCLQPQQTTPKRWPFPQRPTINITAPISKQEESLPQPTTPPPVDENVKLTYKALESEDDVFVEEKENKQEEDVEELFLRKVGKGLISPPISPEKPENVVVKMKASKNKSSAGRRLEFPLPDVRNNNGRREFFGILLPESKEVKIKAKEEYDVIQSIETKGKDRIVPTRLNRNSVSLCLDSDDLKAIEDEDYCATDGDYTEEEDETDATDFGPRFPSFKRRLRKRKPMGVVRNTANFFLAEKRAKDAPDLLMLTIGSQKHADEHCVPSISI